MLVGYTFPRNTVFAPLTIISVVYLVRQDHCRGRGGWLASDLRISGCCLLNFCHLLNVSSRLDSTALLALDRNPRRTFS